MGFSFVNALEEEYVNCEMTFLENYNKDVKESDDFHDKYIKPLLAKNQKAGFELEDDFLSAVSAQKSQSFKDGFKACMQMMLECASDKSRNKERNKSKLMP